MEERKNPSPLNKKRCFLESVAPLALERITIQVQRRKKKLNDNKKNVILQIKFWISIKLVNSISLSLEKSIYIFILISFIREEKKNALWIPPRCTFSFNHSLKFNYLSFNTTCARYNSQYDRKFSQSSTVT